MDELVAELGVGWTGFLPAAEVALEAVRQSSPKRKCGDGDRLKDRDQLRRSEAPAKKRREAEAHSARAVD